MGLHKGPNRRLSCLTPSWKDEDKNKAKATYAWIGLGLGSVLTLFGVWKGRQNAWCGARSPSDGCV